MLGDLELELVAGPAAKHSGGLRSVFRSSLAYLLLILKQGNKPRGSSGATLARNVQRVPLFKHSYQVPHYTCDQRIPLVKQECYETCELHSFNCKGSDAPGHLPSTTIVDNADRIKCMEGKSALCDNQRCVRHTRVVIPQLVTASVVFGTHGWSSPNWLQLLCD